MTDNTDESRSMALVAAVQVIAPDGDPPGRSKQSINDLLRDTEISMEEAYVHFSRLAAQDSYVSYGAEWLLDNYYIVQRSLRQVRQDMPKRFYQELPRLDAPISWRGLPRVYHLAAKIIEFSDGRVDEQTLSALLRAYQESTSLTIGEIWALPTMLRMGLLDYVARALLRHGQLRKPDASRLGEVPKRNVDLSDETQIANGFLGLHALQAVEWQDFFEAHNSVEQTLRTDPANVYGAMDFATRDRYRSAVEKLAKHSQANEFTIAHRAIGLAQAAQDAGVPQPADHVGYFLVDQGRPSLEAAIDFREPLFVRAWHGLLSHPTALYLGSIVIVTVLLLGWVSAYVLGRGEGLGGVVLTLLITFIPMMSLGISLVNGLAGHARGPNLLPKLDFSDHIPEQFRTLVVVPALLTSEAEVCSLLRQTEQHYLKNRDPHLRVALLTDFVDAPQETMPEDDALLDQASAGIEALNLRYADEGIRPFYFMHRRRLWNEAEGVWMGWERKRGKITELNRVLRGATDTSYVIIQGDTEVLQHVCYVITLDSDTELPLGSAARLVGALAHPLNQAHFDEETGHVAAGYTILQPRTEIKPVSALNTWFSHIFAGDSGFDIYTRAVSDIYQDLFGEGIFVGKGIYHVDDFARSVQDRVPDNTVLSHDLFEGISGRCALVTDVVLYEDFPAQYGAYAWRKHRWVRGDWQLLPWLQRTVPHVVQGAVPTSFSLIDRWKIWDNLRRSLLMPAVLLLLMSGWLWLPGSAWLWTGVALLLLSAALLTQLLNWIAQSLSTGVWGGFVESHRLPFERLVVTLVFIPYSAWLALDAIVRILVRMTITRRHLLEWTSSSQVTILFRNQRGIVKTWAEMAISPLLAVIVAVMVAFEAPTALGVAAPLLLAWFAAPQIAYFLSLPRQEVPSPLSTEDKTRLRLLARRTWLYFEHFLTPEDNWLPPDHFQESPRSMVAHRTSPTNMGLALLSTLAARDLGYEGLLMTVARLQSAFDSLTQLERYNGHFLNWYETRSLDPLPPRYVSAVDSGNLAVCLIVLNQGLQELMDEPILDPRRLCGLSDTLGLLQEAVHGLTRDGSAKELEDHLHKMIQGVPTEDVGGDQWIDVLDSLRTQSIPVLNKLIDVLLSSEGREILPEHLHRLRMWIQALDHQIRDMEREQETLAPWLRTCRNSPAWLQSAVRADPQIAAAWDDLRFCLASALSPRDICSIQDQAGIKLERLADLLSQCGATAAAPADTSDWIAHFRQMLAGACAEAKQAVGSLNKLADQADQWVDEMDFAFLYDKHRAVFHIGFNVDNGESDQNYYDLLASEARLASLIAIAKDEVPAEHWLHLGRPLNELNGRRVLLSWSGTMFEYLMPILFVRSFPQTLLHQSNKAVVAHQIAYARERQLPWGVSESGYYRFDANMAYQYQAFGVPGLGLKRGLGDDQVVAPYASILALPIQPQAVMENLDDLVARGMMGDYGLYEAIDFTSARLPRAEASAVVRSFMVHHHGMSLLALLNYLQEDPMVQRFHRDPRIRSVELLLQEHIPHHVAVEELGDEELPISQTVDPDVKSTAWQVPVATPSPQGHILSNGNFGSFITNSGAGFSLWRGRAVTRWRKDTTLDDWGGWIYIKNDDTGDLWSLTPQPIHNPEAHYDIHFAPHQIQFLSRFGSVAGRLEIAVAPEEDVEIRRIHLHNQGDKPCRLTLISYAELTMADQKADRQHSAFNKMFVESEHDRETGALVFRRRLRAHDEEPFFVAHTAIPAAGEFGQVSHETDRRRFLGRGHTVHNPKILTQSRVKLSNTTGATLDPIMALAQTVDVDAHGTVDLAFITVAAASWAEATDLIKEYQSWNRLTQAFDQARRESERELREFTLTSGDVQRMSQLLSALFYPSPALRSKPDILAANRLGQPGLWPLGISGDFPIMLVRVHDDDDIFLLQEAIRAHRYWRDRGLSIDLVIRNEKESGYAQELQGKIRQLLGRTNSDAWLNRRGGIFVVRNETVDLRTKTLLETVAMVDLDGSRADLLADHLTELHDHPGTLPVFAATRPEADNGYAPPLSRPKNLRFDNGLGGFSPDGREYVIYLEKGQTTPAPWINVIANEHFGFLVTEAGGGYTWAGNSGENRLTPWSNDPVSDPAGEAVYLRDEETGAIWSPTPLPASGAEPYLIRHGAGYSVFSHNSHGLRHEMTLFCPVDAPLKVVKLKLANSLERERRITVTHFAEWVLGVNRDIEQVTIVPEYDGETDALLATNPASPEFGDRVAFLVASHRHHGLTTDRTEFLGREGRRDRPVGLQRLGLSGTVQAGRDPCAAFQVHVDLAPGEQTEICFLLGQGENQQEALDLIHRYQKPGQIDQALADVHSFWDDVLGTIQVETPDPAMDLLLNRWLLYQNLSCRIWGRSAFYQSSGAYGFRDQLQDVMALVHTQPQVARAHVLRAAAHQFQLGDVLHWWHPPSGRGVRTRIADDLLWLPYVVSHYVTATGDRAVLDEEIPFRVGTTLDQDEQERYGQFDLSEKSYTLFEHCRQALSRGDTAGPHGLPLFGAGDWNDGMNRVGIGGKGESIWLAWFLSSTLDNFAQMCDDRGEEEAAEKYRKRAAALRQTVDETAWDGKWYLRGFYDDGTALGSADSMECRIDAIAQSWSVLASAAEPSDRSRQAMASVAEHLVAAQQGLIRLFIPPFDKSGRDPGYIAGYPPGIRENGGQYTHAALWTVWAFVRLGDGDRAGDLFRLLNPIYHGNSPDAVARYQVEPYVVAADVYGVLPHTGQGGWTWYTGSAGWMYRLGLEGILGVKGAGDTLAIDPTIPARWTGYELVYRFGTARYRIQVKNPEGVCRGVVTLTVDGIKRKEGTLHLVDDGKTHDVTVCLG